MKSINIPSWEKAVHGACRAGIFAPIALTLFYGVAQAQTGIGGPLQPTPVTPDPTAKATVLRPFALTPSFGVQEAFTDNVYLTQSDRKSDFITRLNAGAQLQVSQGRLQVQDETQAYYDRYANAANLSGFSISTSGTGIYSLSQDHLWLEAEGFLTNGNISTFGASALDRSGVSNRVQLGSYNIGPHLRTTLGDTFDLAAVGRFDQVFYSAPGNVPADGQISPLLSDSNIWQAAMSLDTGNRYRGFQAITRTEYDEDNHGYQTANGLESLFINVAPTVRLIARGGYEYVNLPGAIDIRAPIWSGGFEFTPNDQSKISVERGERYNKPVWTANVLFKLSNTFSLTGQYYESLQPDQVYVAEGFIGSDALAVEAPVPVIPQNFAFFGDLTNQASLNETANAHLIYNTQHHTIDLSINWNDRDFLQSQDHDRILYASIAYSHPLRPDLSMTLQANYGRTSSSPVYGRSEAYGASGFLAYTLNSSTVLTAGYAMTHGYELEAAGQTIIENTLFIAIKKSF